ncbi:juvenile hormone esterase-like [Spodoptera litura]|uniref:Juvenile hormone esterase-like n=1 Tax=Spodoptera litura TaxID=69820 RepID=A0A9J7EJK2_SPOLT|nr:juvenile hormone esterase-like [Spodoptera litura]
MWKLVVLLFCCLAIVLADDSRVVSTAQGPVRGRLLPGGGVYGFYNIPYASAPTGADRYKAPRPPPTWLTIFEAEDRKIICPQHFVTQTMNVQEDCLVVNVFVPDTDEANLPVHVYVHGGAYQFGFGLQEKFTELVKSKKKISVSFNYRLGVHGFLCLGTEAAPGNAGLKDMVALLRWVNTNIASFGGNPDDVTLSSCSAGSGSLDFLTVSSLTEGLFKKVIQESGTVIGAVGTQVDPIQNARNYATVLNFDNVNDLNSLEEFYKSVTIQQLISRTDAILNNEGVTSRFGPCVERDLGQEIFISDTPMNILSRGNYTKVPRMYGFTTMDGSVRLSVFDTWKEMMNEKFSDFLPSEFHFDSEEVKEQVAQRVKQFYFGDSPVGEHNFVSYLNYNTDVLFAFPMLRTLSTRVGALGDPIYLFEYSFVDENSPGFPQTDEIGARHCSQEMIVADGDVTAATNEYKRMQEIMRDYWMNFISNGYPSSSDPSLPTWTPANAQRSPHMSLGRQIVLRDSSPIPERAAFWDELFDEYFRGPIVDMDPVPTTTPTPTPAPGAASSLVMSNIIFVSLLLSFYFTLYLN